MQKDLLCVWKDTQATMTQMRVGTVGKEGKER